ncbi:MAG TPA: hypothetical protein VHZ28_10490 [Terracidiphilus sp.]|nr:hypothetical protein [Terracidiphilus sp.]
MSSITQGVAARPLPSLTGPRGLIDKYFYFGASLLFAAIVVLGFSRTVNPNLLHATPARPVLLWIHGFAFTAWIVVYSVQSALVRVHRVPWHRLFGWVAVALAALMIPLGITVSIIMGRFDAVVLHLSDPTFLSVPFSDMALFGLLVSLAILWRKKPESHRRLLFLATCCLLDAPFGRFDYLFNHTLFFICLDAVILLGLARDLLVNRRIHTVYRYGFPAIVLTQVVVVYLWRGSPAWWLGLTRNILGL